ncbi:MAG: hypothetical protein KBD50_02310 [Candidatus Pacebacteria bacterium]|nr:hypothetical protein [Candidatus Paceibacterota bacterium]
MWGPQAALVGGASFLFFVLIAWSLFWKGLALWHASKKHQPWWFVIILLVNTAGILEIIYLFFVAKIKTDRLFKQ